MVAPSSNKQEEESVAATTPTNTNASKDKAKSSSSKGKRRKLPKAVTDRSADEPPAGGGAAIAENQRSSNGSGKTATEVEGDSKINKVKGKLQGLGVCPAYETKLYYTALHFSDT